MAPEMRASIHPSFALALLIALPSVPAMAQEPVSPVAPGPRSSMESRPLWGQSSVTTADRPVRVLESDAPLPAGLRPERHPRSDLITAGLSIGLAMYSLSLTVAAGCGAGSCAANAHDRALLIPVAGPFVQMAWTEKPVGNVFLAIDGLGQLAGVGLVAAAFMFPRETLVGTASAPFRLLPLVGSGLTGVAAVGRF